MNATRRSMSARRGAANVGAAVAGAAAILMARPILPSALAFAAGAMIFVVVEELIPEGHRGGHS